jgi:hypothetical protein
VLLLSIAKWRNLLTSQLLVYDGDRQAPLNLLNLLPEETDLDPDTWLMHHMLILAFLHKIANASTIQQKIFLKEPVHIYNILRVLDITKFHPNVRIARGLWYTGEISMHQLFCKRYSLRNRYISTRSYESWIPPNFIPMYASYIDSGTRENFHLSWRNPQLGKIQLYILYCVESYAMCTPFLNGRSLILRLK